MIIWSGHGYLIAVAVFGMSLLMELATESAFKDDNYYQEQWWPIFTALALAALISFGVGLLFKTRDPHRSHTLFFIPMLYWGPILAVIAVATAVWRVVDGG